MCIHVPAQMDMHVVARGQCWVAFSIVFHLLLNLELDWLSHQAQGSSSLPPHCQDVEGPGLLGWPWGPKLKFSRLLGKLSLPTELSSVFQKIDL